MRRSPCPVLGPRRVRARRRGCCSGFSFALLCLRCLISLGVCGVVGGAQGVLGLRFILRAADRSCSSAFAAAPVPLSRGGCELLRFDFFFGLSQSVLSLSWPTVCWVNIYLGPFVRELIIPHTAMLEGLFVLSSVWWLQLDSVTYILVVMPHLVHAGNGVGWREGHLVWS